MSHTAEDLRALQAKTLKEKIQISTARIIEWYEHWNGQVYISNSGGVDSTVLSHLVHPNKFQTLAQTHPQLYDYCMRGGKYNTDGKWVPDKGLGMAKVLDFINVKWWNDGDEAKRDEYRAKYKDKELNK